MWSSAMYNGCGESLKSVDPGAIHRKLCIAMQKGCGESFRSVHHGGIHRWWSLVLSPLLRNPRECRGDVAFPPTSGPPRRQGLGSQF